MRAIITFHSIDDKATVLSYPPRRFARLLEALAHAGVPIRDLDALLADEAADGVALSFDDGMRSVFTAALPILKDHGAPAHLFLTTGQVGGDNLWPGQPAGAPRYDLLDWGQIEALHEAGVRIESHSASHPDFRALSEAAMTAECEAADEAIATRLYRRPRYFAYPYGYHDARVRRIMGARYRACLTTELRFLTSRDTPAALPRLDSYYLGSPWLYRHLAAPHSRAYLALRHALRRLRGAL
ncbi:MAG: polysaccharide deacetylase family protein [Pseudomonadota bacterium]